MNEIHTHPLAELGYNFIDAKYIPKSADEYYLRNSQNPDATAYSPLSAQQRETLISNRNSSDNWEKILVSPEFDANLVKNCKFFGMVRIGTLRPCYREFHNLRLPVGLYNSTIISCDFGDNVCIDNVHYLSHYIISKDVMIANVNEFETTDYSKFGNGIVKEGEEEKSRTWVEVCNENGGRSILPFNGMLPGDAYLWAKYRDDDKLLEQFKHFTQKELDDKRGYYGTVGERTVIKNCGIIKDVNIGSDAYLKGANKIKNVTINSDGLRKSQIGEGCELVNGVVGFGCRIFYGVKAVRFILASHSQLKYGARLINSYLGNNSTISCCEVLNSLIFPSHEQHHNNSFLCAALIMGQSNIAAGATIGSNHNSRSADGEIQAGRGFWPGLCVSLKHNSKFAAFTLISKGDFPSELNIHLPFSLVSNDTANDRLVVMPAYWFMYNMYALERNAHKYRARDRRTEKIQSIEYDYLAPDTINEIFDALAFLEKLKTDQSGTAVTDGFENSRRKTHVVKVPDAMAMYRNLVVYYGTVALMRHAVEHGYSDFETFKASLPVKISRGTFQNLGGQLMPAETVAALKKQVKSGKLASWNDVHQFYREAGKKYPGEMLEHAYASLMEILGLTVKQFTPELFDELLEQAGAEKKRMTDAIRLTREKDYTNPYRRMVYETTEEMYRVLGPPEDNSFVQSECKGLEDFLTQIKELRKTFEFAP